MRIPGVQCALLLLSAKRAQLSLETVLHLGCFFERLNLLMAGYME